MIDCKLINENGYTYRYMVSKKPNARNMVFIHGFATTSEYYDDYVEKLIENYNYYAIQLPGHGYAKIKHQSQLNPLFYVQYITEWIKEKNFKDFVLIGHSMGGGIAIMVSNLVGDRINKTVAITPMNSTLWFGFRGLNAFKLLPNTDEKNWKNKKILLHKPDEYYVNGNDAKLKNETLYFLKHMKEFKILRRKMTSLKLYSELKQAEKNIPVKTLLIIGKHDGIISYPSTYKNFKKYPNYETVTFDESAHLPFMEENEKFIITVSDFLDK